MAAAQGRLRSMGARGDLHHPEVTVPGTGSMRALLPSTAPPTGDPERGSIQTGRANCGILQTAAGTLKPWTDRVSKR